MSGTAASGTSSSRLSMLLCCRWWTSLWTSSSSFARLLLPSRFSKCPRFCSRKRTRSAERSASRSWRNSCWKCQQSSASRSRPLTLQFLGARVRRRGDLQGFHTGQGSTAPLGAEQNVDISGLGGESDSDIVKVFSQNRVSTAPQFVEQIVDILVPAEVFKGFFALFTERKKCEGHRAGQCGAGCAPQLIHAERSSNGSYRVGRCQ